MTRTDLGLLTAAALGAMAATSAEAAPLVRNFVVTGAQFAYLSGDATAPADPVTLDVTLTFDTAADYGGSTQGLVVNGFSLPFAVTFGYNHATDVLIFGSSTAVNSCDDLAPNSFCAYLLGAGSASPVLFGMTQDTPTGGYWSATSLSASFRDLPAVPETSTWAMLITGLGFVGTALRRRIVHHTPRIQLIC